MYVVKKEFYLVKATPCSLVTSKLLVFCKTEIMATETALVSSGPLVRIGPVHSCTTVKVSGEGWQLQGIVGLQAKNTI